MYVSFVILSLARTRAAFTGSSPGVRIRHRRPSTRLDRVL